MPLQVRQAWPPFSTKSRWLTYVRRKSLAENSGGVVHVMVRNSSIINNFDAGLHSESGGTTIRVTRSTITGNGAGWAVFSGGVISSYGDNNIDGNGTDNTAPPSIAYK